MTSGLPAHPGGRSFCGPDVQDGQAVESQADPHIGCEGPHRQAIPHRPTLTAPPLPLLHIRVVGGDSRPSSRPLHRPQSLGTRPHLSGADRAPRPVPVRQGDKQPHPLRQLQHPHRARRIPRCQHLPPPLRPRPVRLDRGLRHRPRPRHIQSREHLGRIPQRLRQLPLGLPERRHVRGRRLPYGKHMPHHLGMHITLGADLVHLRHQPERGPVADDGLLRVQRPRIELRRSAQPQRMPGRRQGDPQPRHPERPQPPQREGETDGRRLTRQPLHPVHGVLAHDGENGVVRRDKSGQQGISPGGKAS